MDGWPRAVFLALDWLWTLSGLACLIAAFLAVAGKFSFFSINARLSRLQKRPAGKWLLPASIPLILCLNKAAQYYSFLLGWDTGVVGNYCWNIINGYGWTSSLIGNATYLTVHFAFIFAVLSPLLLLWTNVMALVLVQAVVIGSSIWGVFLLGREHCRQPWAAWCLAILALSQPSFQGIGVEFLDNSVFAFPLFIWAAYCWEKGNIRAAVMLGMLHLITGEQAPFLLLGLGLMVVAGATKPRQRAIGACIATGSVVLWLGELLIIRHSRGLQVDAFRSYLNQSYWGLYGSLGGSPQGLFETAIRRPWKFIIALLYPHTKIWVVFRIFLSYALLPLASGAYIIPSLVVWLPFQLGDRTLYLLKGHYSAMIFGPFSWAAAIGLGRILKRVPPKAHRHVMSVLLVVSGVCFLESAQFMPSADLWIIRSWRYSALTAFIYIPRDAKLWCDDMLAPSFSMRRYIKTFPHDAKTSAFFETGLFMPDRVILTRRWLGLAERSIRGRILGFLENRGFVPIFQNDDFIILANPFTMADGSEALVPVALEDVDVDNSGRVHTN